MAVLAVIVGGVIMQESAGQENMILTSRSLASKNYFFFAGFFGAAFFGAAFAGAAFAGVAFFGAAFSGTAFFGAGFLGAAFAIIPSFWSWVSIPFAIILFIVSYQKHFKPPGLLNQEDPPSAHRLSIGLSYWARGYYLSHPL